jgi:FkbM family methyltransferase
MMALAGRRFGGIRPRRITHTLGKWAFEEVPRESDFYSFRDRYGSKMLVHPHFLIDREIIANGIYDAELHAYIERNVEPGMLCIDVGANVGTVALHLATRVGAMGRVICFEPIPHLYRRLCENITENHLEDIVTPVKLALVDHCSRALMAVADETLPNQGMASLVEFSHGLLSERLEVECRTLDAFVEQHNIHRLDLIKVDIQGAESMFLDGARQTLRNLKPRLLMEVAPSSQQCVGFDSRDLIRKIEELGYEVHELRSHGQLGRRIASWECPTDYTANNALCLPKG